jgi:SAM-dependent methyltransferase
MSGKLAEAEALASAARLHEALPPDIAPFFGVGFVRSHFLYGEFIYRLVLQVARASGIDAALSEPSTTAQVADRARLDPGQGIVALDWMLRFLASRGTVDELLDGGTRRYRAHGGLPDLDPAVVREEQLQHEPSWMPAYALAETAAREYPAFLRAEVVGEDVLFSARRLRLWIDYFSNDNPLYAVNNRVGAIAVDEWLPRSAAVVLELGGGLGSGALALLERLQARARLDAIADYHFTEFVAAFLRRGEQALRARYPALRCLRCTSLDMNRSFAEQGIPPGSVSVVYAVNTLHVAHDLDATLSEVFRALEPGGCLIASECVRPLPLQPIDAEFVFNLTATFRSPRLQPSHRPSGGFLTPEQWRGAMETAGFTDVRLLPDVERLRDQVPDFTVAAIGARRGA